MKGLFEMGAERGAFIDQSQSLNLFVESNDRKTFQHVHVCLEQGLKTTYYFRFRPATSIAKQLFDVAISVQIQQTQQRKTHCNIGGRVCDKASMPPCPHSTAKTYLIGSDRLFFENPSMQTCQ